MNINLKDIPTCELVEELKTREGVKVEEYRPYEPYKAEGEGPAVILIVED